MTPTKLSPVEGYTLINKLGEGTSGEVWKVEKNGSIFALKLFKPGYETTIFAEFDTLCKINHPNIIEEYEIGTYEGQPCLVMEYLDGMPLNEINAFDFSISEIETIVKNLASALQHAHEQGLIHRDLKPANIFILPNGKVKVLDFGVATPISYNPNAKLVAGSYSYMSPEQLAGKINFQSDIWSFGICLYEWLTGKHPFQSKDLRELSQKMLLPKMEIPHFVENRTSAKLSYIILKCLRQNLEQRYKSFTHVIADLEGDPLTELSSQFKAKKWFNKDLVKDLTKWYSIKTVFLPYLIYGFIGAFIMVGALALIFGEEETDIQNKPARIATIILSIYIFGTIFVFLPLWNRISKQFKINIKKDLLGLSVLTDKTTFMKLVTQLIKQAKGRLTFETNAASFVLQWFWEDAGPNTAQKIAENLYGGDRKNILALSYFLKEALDANNQQDIDLYTKAILSVNKDHAAELIRNKFVEGKEESEFVPSQSFAFAPTLKKTEETSDHSEVQSKLAKQIIEEGSVNFSLVNNTELVLYDNYLEYHIKDQISVVTTNIPYEDIVTYKSTGELIALNDHKATSELDEFRKSKTAKWFRKQTSGWTIASRMNHLLDHNTTLQKTVGLMFKQLHSAKLWAELLAEIAKDAEIEAIEKPVLFEEKPEKEPLWRQILSSIYFKIGIGVLFLIWITGLYNSFIDFFYLLLDIPQIFKQLIGEESVSGPPAFALLVVLAAGYLFIRYGLPFLWKQFNIWRMGKERYEESKEDDQQVFIKLYVRTLQFYLLNPDITITEKRFKAAPLVFDFDKELVFVKKKAIHFSKIKSIVFTPKRCYFYGLNRSTLAQFKYKATFHKYYCPILVKYWGDQIEFATKKK